MKSVKREKVLSQEEIKSNFVKTALVTGASSGLGEQFCRHLARRGFNLVISARRKNLLVDLKKEIEAKHTIKVNIIVQDLSKSNSVKCIVDEVSREGIIITHLVNNAGYGYYGALGEQPFSFWRDLINVNQNAMVELSYVYAKQMAERGFGTIVNVSSLAGFFSLSGFNVYAASKAFMINFSTALAGELSSKGVQVTVVCPGPTKTEFDKVAALKHPLAVKRIPSMKSSNVVKIALKAMDKGKLICVPGYRNRVLYYLSRFIPRALLNKISAKLFISE